MTDKVTKCHYGFQPSASACFLLPLCCGHWCGMFLIPQNCDIATFRARCSLSEQVLMSQNWQNRRAANELNDIAKLHVTPCLQNKMNNTLLFWKDIIATALAKLKRFLQMFLTSIGPGLSFQVGPDFLCVWSLHVLDWRLWYASRVNQSRVYFLLLPFYVCAPEIGSLTKLRYKEGKNMDGWICPWVVLTPDNWLSLLITVVFYS